MPDIVNVTYIGPLDRLIVLGFGEFKKNVPQEIDKDNANRLGQVNGFKIEQVNEIENHDLQIPSETPSPDNSATVGPSTEGKPGEAEPSRPKRSKR